jgi:hypothetical protein
MRAVKEWQNSRQREHRAAVMAAVNFRHVSRALGSLLAALALFVVAGGHWIVLQSVAWAGMLASYSRTAPMTVAVAETFDGAHPCPLCKAVTAGRKSERGAAPMVKAMGKIFALVAAVAAMATPRAKAFNYGRPAEADYPARFAGPEAPIPIRGGVPFTF